MPFKPNWSFANDFVCEKTGVFVVVTKTNHKVPQFSIAEIGRYKEVETRNGTKQVPVNYVGIRAEKDNILSGNLEWTQFEALQAQLDAAADWIDEQHKLNCEHMREMEAEGGNAKPVAHKTHNVQKGNAKKSHGRRQSVRVEHASPEPEFDEPEFGADQVA